MLLRAWFILFVFVSAVFAADPSEMDDSPSFSKISGLPEVKVVYRVTNTAEEYRFVHSDDGLASDTLYFSFIAPADGRYGIVVRPEYSHESLGYSKCTDDDYTSCENALGAKEKVEGSFVDSVTVSKGEEICFIVVAYNDYEAVQWVSVRYTDLDAKRLSIKILSNSGGTVNPADGYAEALPNTFYRIEGMANEFGYRFDSWTVKSGEAAIEDKNSKETFVTVTSDAILQANFKKGVVHSLSDSEKAFTYSKDFYSDTSFYRDGKSLYSGYGVALKWTSPDTGLYLLNVEDSDGYFYVYDFETDDSFKTLSSTKSYSYRISEQIRASKKGETFYWIVSSGNTKESHTFKASVVKMHHLSVLADDNGYLYSYSSIEVPAGVDTTISAYGNIGYLFKKWKVVSGDVSIADVNSRETTASIKNDATIKATFTKGPVQKISEENSSWTFNKDKFTDHPNYNNCVLMTWTAPDERYYFVELDLKNEAYLKNFNTDSTLLYSAPTYYYSSGKNAFGFVGESGVAQYWAVCTSYKSDSAASYSVKISKGYSLTIDFDSNKGTVSPSDSIKLIKGRDTTISASSKVGYIFDGWNKVSGSVSIESNESQSTNVSIKGDAKIKANFRKGPIQKIGTKRKTFTFNEDYFTDSPGRVHEVAMTWTAPDSAWYYLEIDRSDETLSLGNLGIYDTSTTFIGTTQRYALPASVLFRGAAGIPQYWSFKNYSTADSSLSFSVKIVKAKELNVVSDGHGTVTPSNSVPLDDRKDVKISAESDFGYKFNEWVQVEGTPEIANSKSRVTSVTADGDATVKATFSKGTIQSIKTSKKNFVFAEDDYTDTTNFENFVFMSWKAPDTNWYYIEIEADSAIDLQLYDFGTSIKSSKERLTQDTRKFNLVFQGSKNAKHYWALGPRYARDSLVGFSAKISVPYVLTVESFEHGRVYPEGAVVMPFGGDTTVKAVPYGGYVFNKWKVTKGKATIEDPTNEETLVTLVDSVSAIEATYVMDMTTVPKLDVQSVSIADHPEICSIVSVVDSNNGRSIFDLDSSDFVLFEDGKSLPATVTLPKNIMGVSVVFVVDESGSIGSIQDAAREYVTRFVNEMESFDRVAIIGYVDTVRVVQGYTSNKDSLLDAITRLRFTGAYEDIALGAYSGVELGGELGGAKAIIVFSDGMSDHKKYTASKVVDLAGIFSTSIYTISFKKSADFISRKSTMSNYGFDILQEMSSGTGGRYYETAGIEETREILAEIRNDLQTRYKVCYTTPDTIINGDIHHIKIRASYRGKTTADTADWLEDFLPPKVRLSEKTAKLVGETLKTDSLTVSVYVSSRLPMNSVKLYARTNGTTSVFSTYSMKHVKDSLWTVSIPPSELHIPGIDFYVTATDSLYKIGNAPNVFDPSGLPYTVYIKNLPASIKLESEGCVDTTEAEVDLSFKITDRDGVDSARISFRNGSKKSFTTMALKQRRKGSSFWNVTVPTKAFGGKDLEYYVEAFDNQGVVTRWGTTENRVLKGCENNNADDEKDIIKIVNGDDSGKPIVRSTKKIKLTLESQDFTDELDTLEVSLFCLESGDIESKLLLAEKKKGYYEITKSVVKNEYSPKRNDGKISCEARDTLVAEFMDPVYKTVARDTVVITESVVATYRFLDKAGKVDLDSVETSDSIAFTIRVTAEGKSTQIRDTIKVLLFTDAGDTIEVKAVETGKNTSQFEYKSAFYFAGDEDEMRSDRLDAIFDYEKNYNRVKIFAGVREDESSLKSRDSLIIFSHYVGADYAEIYDRDQDGQADSLRIHFIEPLAGNIVSIDSVFWNNDGQDWRKVSKSEMRLSRDSRWVEAIVREPFEYGVTAVDKNNDAYLRMRKTKSDHHQKVKILDKVGAVPVKAIKHPGRVPTVDYIQKSYTVPPDTLYIEMPEVLSSENGRNAWKNLFRYSKSCSDTVTMNLRIQGEPKIDKSGREWRIILQDRGVFVDGCVRTNPDSKYVDDQMNVVGVGGVSIGGMNSDKYIYEAASNYKLTKADKSPKWIPPGEKRWTKVPDSLQTVRIAAIAPYKAQIVIYDNLSNVVASFSQTFTQEEMDMDARGNGYDLSKIGFLYWDKRSSEGRLVGNGVYIWRIDFKFNDGHKEYRLLKTGVMRNQ